MLYRLSGQTLRVEYSHYEPDEGQPLDCLDLDRVEDLNGIGLPPMSCLIISSSVPW